MDIGLPWHVLLYHKKSGILSPTYNYTYRPYLHCLVDIRNQTRLVWLVSHMDCGAILCIHVQWHINVLGENATCSKLCHGEYKLCHSSGVYFVGRRFNPGMKPNTLKLWATQWMSVLHTCLLHSISLSPRFPSPLATLPPPKCVSSRKGRQATEERAAE